MREEGAGLLRPPTWVLIAASYQAARVEAALVYVELQWDGVELLLYCIMDVAITPRAHRV